ncbi:MAG TPA: AMP-binding protein [Vitreimonas sp.]|nr:AMP-binding protein [Vitreimonas sp.]
MRTLLDLLQGAVDRYGDQPALSMRMEDGSTETWTYRDLDRRSRLAAWRLRELGLQPGDRLLTWSPSTPHLAAAYLGAIRARLVLVPLDLRMSREAIDTVVTSAEPQHLLLGTGRDAPDPADAGLQDFPTTRLEAITTEADGSLPLDWESRIATWEPPAPDEIWDLIFTSGTTGRPKGVMLAHDNILATIEACRQVAPRIDYRLVSLLPMSHLFEQAIGLLFALHVGAHVMYVRSRNPRIIFEALRDHRVTAMIVVPQVLDLFWSAIEREAEKQGRAKLFERLRAVARRLPFPLRRLLFRNVHRRLGGALHVFVSSGAFLPPALQRAWEDLGVRVLQGYGSSENGFGTSNTIDDRGLGTVGRPVPPVELRVADDGEVLFRGPTLFKGYWRNAEATASAIDEDGWYHSGDIGSLDGDGRLVLSGRTKDRIVLPNGFKVYPEDVENALRNAGVREAIVVETDPGRIEAVVLDPRRAPLASAGADDRRSDDEIKAFLDGAVRQANAALGPNQRIAAWRFWPEDDFPRTHTLKVKRDPIRSWAAAEAPVPSRDR